MRASRLTKVLVQPERTDSNTIASTGLTVKGVSGQTADLVQVLDSTGAVLHRVGPSQLSPFGLGGSLRMARAKYDFAVDGGVIGTITLASTAVIPDNAIIVAGFVNATTAPVGASATIGIGTTAGSSTTSLKTATAIASYTLDVILDLVPVWTAATAVKMTAAGNICLLTATTALTAGVLEITIFYYVAAA